MREPDLERMQDAVARLQRQNRLMMQAISGLFLICIVMSAWWLLRAAAPVHAAPADNNSILRVRGIVVTDENGIDRVWIGAPLPNPPLFGKRYKRSVSVSGILMFDADGNERSGYVTNDRSPGPVFLSLDSVGAEIGDFTANAGGGVSLQMRNGPSQLLLDSRQTGPSIRLEHKGKTIFEQPPAPAIEKK